eukprot:scaffold98264_cov36-Prasinocladus_malaysianus.AAC.1
MALLISGVDESDPDNEDEEEEDVTAASQRSTKGSEGPPESEVPQQGTVGVFRPMVTSYSLE